MMSDSMRMANVLEVNGYEVHCLFCELLPQYFASTFFNMKVGINWLNRQGGAGRYESAVDATHDLHGNKDTVVAKLVELSRRFADGDSVLVYMRSHGFADPAGSILTHAEVIKALATRCAV